MRYDLIGQEKNIVRIKIEIEASEFTKALNKTLSELSQQVNIPGFRKGHIKRSVLELRFGRDAIYNEALDKILPDQIKKAVEDYELDLLEQPELKLDAPIEEGKDITGELVCEVRPEVTLPEIDGMEIEKQSTEVNEEAVDRLAKRIQIQMADIKETDRPIQDEDLVDIELTIRTLNDDGTESSEQPKPEATHEKINLADTTIRQQVREALIGKSKGDEATATFDVEENHSDRALAGKHVSYKMKVETVSEYILPEINEEFYKNVFGENTDIKDNETFRARLRKDLEAEIIETSKNDLQTRAVDMVVNASTVEVPDTLIERQSHALRHDDEEWAKANNVNLNEAYGLDTEEGRKGYERLLRDRAETAVKNVLVMDAAAKKYDVHLEQEDLDAEFERRANQLNVSKGFVAKYFYENRNQLDRLVDELRWEKIADVFISHMTVKEAQPQENNA
ncbi:MAG: trigger factor [Synergistaceae bacterium]|nr:trigger factor [Synergistaceae bacterium]